MKLFRQILGKNNEPETLETKIKKLDGQPQAALEAIVTAAGQELEIRKSALSLLAYGPLIEKLAKASDEPLELQKVARQRIASTLDEGSLSIDSLIASIDDTDALLAISGFCSKVDLETVVLAKITDQALLAELCAQASSASVRQSLAQRITEPAQLRKLAKSLKTKDKKAYKTVKAKIDAIKDEEHKATEINSKINELYDDIMQLKVRSVDKDFLLKTDRLRRRWREVEEHATAEKIEQFRSALAVCEDNIDAYKAAAKAEEEFNNKVSGAESNRQKLLLDVWGLITALYNCEKFDDIFLQNARAKSDELKQAWKELKQYGKPSPGEIKDYTQMLEAVELLLGAYNETGTLLEHQSLISEKDIDAAIRKEHIKFIRKLLYPIQALTHYTTPMSVEKTLSTLAVLDADYASSMEEKQKRIRHIGGLIKKASIAADQGRLRQAIGIRHSINEKQDGIDTLPTNLTRQLETLDIAIQKLVDWQAYAVVPKKHTLIASMEKLVGSDVPPEALATKIKNLQDEWKSLSQSGKDRQEELWQKFSELADKAYEPCKIYYQNLADTRKENLEKRKHLVNQLNDFYRDYDWENADWKHVESILSTARSELHSYAPVDRSTNKPVIESFEKAIASIREKLDQELDKNKAAKERLIQQAEKLSDIADLQQAIDTAKRLQMQWKNIGRSHYRDNDKLWKAFRGHCDVVFDKKQQAYEAQRAEVDAIIAKAKEILAKLEAMVNLPSDELLASRTERDTLQKEFFQIEGMPEKVQRGIERDIKKVLEKIDSMLNDAKRNDEANAWKAYFDACTKINDYAFATSQSADNTEALKAELDSFIDGVSRWPEGCLSIIKQNVDGTLNQASDSNIKALKLLCIRTEILSEKATPEADKALRMEYQVSMLQKGIGAVGQDENVGVKIAKEWGGTGPVEPEIYTQLFHRFYENWRLLNV